MNLAEKIRRARERDVEVGGFTFTVRRPTDIEMLAMRGGIDIESLIGYVVGWKNVKAIDMVPGGDPVPAEFDAELAREWLSDRPDLLAPLVDAVLSSYREHVEGLGATAKN